MLSNFQSKKKLKRKGLCRWRPFISLCWECDGFIIAGRPKKQWRALEQFAIYCDMYLEARFVLNNEWGKAHDYPNFPVRNRFAVFIISRSILHLCEQCRIGRYFSNYLIIKHRLNNYLFKWPVCRRESSNARRKLG